MGPSSETNRRAAWPLIGRREELDHLRRLRADARPTSAFISGPAGVGKTRLAREAMAEAEQQGWATLEIRGSAGFAGVPLGPFRTVLQLPASSDLTELTEAVARQLVARRSPTGLLMLADDSQALDEFSCALLQQVVASQLLVAIFTLRTGTPAPPALTDIWKDGFADRIDLQNLSQSETTELLVAGLGGSVQDSSANRIWSVTAGNPLSLREVVLSSEETGALTCIDGEWRWQGEWASGARLREIVTARLGRLDPDELTTMEMLTLAGSLPLGVLAGLSTAAAIERLEARGLVTTEQSGRRLEVALAHRLQAEVLHRGMPALQQRAIRRNLVDALLATGARRTADKVRIACWSLESGHEVDPMTLALGADASLFAIGRSISARLSEILPGGPRDVPGDSPSVPQDRAMAIRLARAAYDRTGELRDGVTLARTLAWTGATEDAESVLAELSGQSEDVDDRIRVALGLAWVQFWGQYHVEEARTSLLHVAAEADGTDGDRSLRGDLYEMLAGISLNTAQPAAALAYAERSAAAQGVELGMSASAAAAAAALGYLGRCQEALALVERAVPVARDQGHPLAVANLLVARAGALTQLGALDQACALVEWLREVAMSADLLDATAVFGVVLGEILLQQGRAGSAGRIFRDASGLLAERDILGYRPWALSGLARARALGGEEASAAAALDEVRRIQPIERHFDMSHFMAEIELHRMAGRTDAALRAARAAVAWARSAGMVGNEAQGLDAWFRILPAPEVATRLAALAAMTDSPLVGALADRARAVVASDPASLLEVSERLAQMTAWWSAADTAAAAADLLHRQHGGRAAQAAIRRAETYAAHCEGRRLRSFEGPAAPVRLTKREREISALAAAGRSTKEIALGMSLSPRTVENHLYHAYVKLGVTDRTSLAEALAPEPAPE